MIEETATVVACEDGFAIVETQSKAACGACGAEHSCSTSVLSDLFKRRHNRLKVLNPIQATPGQKVVVGIQEQALVTVSLMAYLMPLMCLILAAMATQQVALYWGWSYAELSSIAGGLLGLMAGLSLLKRFSLRNKHEPAFQAVILRLEVSQPVQFFYGNSE